MAEATENPATVAASAPEPQADQIQYLTPTPPGFTPEYDYLALIKSISDTADFATADPFDASTHQPLKAFPVPARGGLRRLFLIGNSEYSEWMWSNQLDSEDEMERMYEQIQDLRPQLVEGRQGDPRILVVNDINQSLLQVLGVAIDLDPTFVWRHYNQDLNSDIYSSWMATLRYRYFSLVTATRTRRAGTISDQEQPTDEDRNLHMRYNLGASRAIRDPEAYQVSSHISCYYIMANRCEYPFVSRLLITYRRR